MLSIAFVPMIFGQKLVRVSSIYSPCETVNAQDVISLDTGTIQLGCKDGQVFVFNHQLNQIQSFSASSNPITSVANSTETQQYMLYVTTSNGTLFNGNFVERFNKSNVAVTGAAIQSLADQKRLATDKDANLACAKVLGIDLVVAAISYNQEINPVVSCAADKFNIYVSSGLQPAKVIRGDVEFPFPTGAYKQNSVTVYDQSGNIITSLTNELIGGCASNPYSDSNVLLRTCSSNLQNNSGGKGMLIDVVTKIPGQSVFFNKPFASSAAATLFGGTEYVVVGTLGSELDLLKIDANGNPTQIDSTDLFTTFKWTPLEPYYGADRKLQLNTDLMIQSVVALNDTFVVLSRPRWPQAAQGTFFNQVTIPSAQPTISVYKIQQQ